MKPVTASTVAIIAILAASPAAATWTHRPSEASDDLGSAFVRNEQGHVLDVGCGNGGEVSLQLRTDIQGGPANQDLNFVFPGMDGMISAPFLCEGGVCSSGYQYSTGQAWTERQKTSLINAFRSGSEVSVHRPGESAPLTSFTLRGSSVALGRLKSSVDYCIGL